MARDRMPSTTVLSSQKPINLPVERSFKREVMRVIALLLLLLIMLGPACSFQLPERLRSRSRRIVKSRLFGIHEWRDLV